MCVIGRDPTGCDECRRDKRENAIENGEFGKLCESFFRSRLRGNGGCRLVSVRSSARLGRILAFGVCFS